MGRIAELLEGKVQRREHQFNLELEGIVNVEMKKLGLTWDHGPMGAHGRIGTISGDEADWTELVKAVAKALGAKLNKSTNHLEIEVKRSDGQAYWGLDLDLTSGEVEILSTLR